MSSIYRIGDFSFVALSRAFSRPMQQVEREIKPGTDGVSLWRTGKRGEPFELLSFADVADVAAGQALLAAYEDAAGGDPVAAVWDGEEFDGSLFIHRVMPPPGGLRKTLIGVGGLLGSSHAYLRAIWLVEPLDAFTWSISQEP